MPVSVVRGDNAEPRLGTLPAAEGLSLDGPADARAALFIVKLLGRLLGVFVPKADKEAELLEVLSDRKL